jgi:hypothetical protein
MCLAQRKHMLGGGDCNNNDNNNNDNEISFETFYTTTVKQNGYSARVGARHFFKYFSIVSISKSNTGC